MGVYDLTLGALLVGVVLNTYLYGVLTFQYGSYWSTKFNDPLWMKSVVGALFCIDTVHSMTVIYMIWVYLVDHFADETFFPRAVWPLQFSAVVVSIIAFGVQNFLAIRVYRLLGMKWLLALFVTASSVTMVLGVTLGGMLMSMDYLPEFFTLKPHLTAWLSMEVVIDSTLSVVLFVTLQQSRTGFRRSDAALNRLTRSAIQSGLFTSIIAIVTLICFLSLPNTLFYGTFGIAIARAYTIEVAISVPSIFGRTDWEMQGITGIRKDVRTEVRFERGNHVATLDTRALDSRSQDSSSPGSPPKKVSEIC